MKSTFGDMFELPDFDRQGKADEDISLNSPDEFRDAGVVLTTSVLRTVHIFTPDLEPVVYDHQPFLDNILQLCRGNRHASVKILVKDSSSAIKRGHGLVRLAQRLTSAIEIRNPVDEYLSMNNAFLITDKRSLMYRPHTESYKGFYNISCEFRANKLEELFKTAWENAIPDIETRNLYL